MVFVALEPALRSVYPQIARSFDGRISQVLMMQRIYGVVLSALLICWSVWPAIQRPSMDSFPFSNYPMFARKKGHPVVHSVVATTSSGERIRVPPR